MHRYLIWVFPSTKAGIRKAEYFAFDSNGLSIDFRLIRITFECNAFCFRIRLSVAASYDNMEVYLSEQYQVESAIIINSADVIELPTNYISIWVQFGVYRHFARSPFILRIGFKDCSRTFELGKVPSALFIVVYVRHSHVHGVLRKSDLPFSTFRLINKKYTWILAKNATVCCELALYIMMKWTTSNRSK